MPGKTLQDLLTFLHVPPDISTKLELRESVWAFVDDRKAAGWSLERIIVAVKAIAREAGLRPTTMVIRRDATPTTVDEFLIEMVGWCIHRYFEQR